MRQTIPMAAHTNRDLIGHRLVYGLLKKSEYNNDMGVVTKEAGGRWCVVLDKGKEISLKVDNLELHVDTADIDNFQVGLV